MNSSALECRDYGLEITTLIFKFVKFCKFGQEIFYIAKILLTATEAIDESCTNAYKYNSSVVDASF